MAMVLSPHTSWALRLVDLSALEQAEEVLSKAGYIRKADGTPAPVARTVDLKPAMLGRMEQLAQYQAERFQWVENPETAPEYLQAALNALGPVAMKRWWIDEINRSSLELKSLEDILRSVEVIS